MLTSALREPGRDLGAAPATTARRNGDGWVLDGVKSTVSYAAEASRILVPAVTDDGVGLFLVEPAAVTMRPVSTTTGEPAAALVLENTPGEPVGAADGAAFDELRQLALAGIIAVSSGVLAGALTLTTEYIRTRKQFGRALAEFQAVTVQIADVYIAGRALDVAVWSGAWLLAEGSPEEAETDLAVGALTVTDAALRALYICQHLHGGSAWT
ncbi:acyl-CoA dehydrogenase family protein [Streptosporangium lutulentum]